MVQLVSMVLKVFSIQIRVKKILDMIVRWNYEQPVATIDVPVLIRSSNDFLGD